MYSFQQTFTLTFILVIALFQVTDTKVGYSTCQEPRPEFCTKEYQKTCGLYNSNVQCFRSPCGSQYSNTCEACQDKNVASYFLGECEEITFQEQQIGTSVGLNQSYTQDEQFTYCTNPRPQFCTLDYRQTCGVFHSDITCLTNGVEVPCSEQYSNGCSACSDIKVEKYYPGQCLTEQIQQFKSLNIRGSADPKTNKKITKKEQSQVKEDDRQLTNEARVYSLLTLGLILANIL